VELGIGATREAMAFTNDELELYFGVSCRYCICSRMGSNFELTRKIGRSFRRMSARGLIGPVRLGGGL